MSCLCLSHHECLNYNHKNSQNVMFCFFFFWLFFFVWLFCFGGFFAAEKVSFQKKRSWCGCTMRWARTLNRLTRAILCVCVCVCVGGGFVWVCVCVCVCVYADITRPAASNRASSEGLNPKWPRRRSWRRSQITRDRTRPCSRGRSETGCWRRASATTTPCPASHPLTGRRWDINYYQEKSGYNAFSPYFL